jgi:hypothetical protein
MTTHAANNELTMTEDKAWNDDESRLETAPSMRISFEIECEN